MTSFPDEILLALAEKYSFKAPWDGTVPYDHIREQSRLLREQVKGSFPEKVTISDGDEWRQFSPNSGASTDLALVYIHGGGWCNCDVYTHGGIMSDLAALSGMEVYGLKYPLAPENPYPAALDILVGKIENIAADTGKELILAGDSAGANLALAAALRLRDDAAGLRSAAMLLWYGCYRAKFDTRSHALYGDGSCGLMTDGMRLFWSHYLGEQATPDYADLSDADMSGLPPAYLCEAECDCLADDSRWLASKLIEAGVPHFYDFHAKATHGFLHYSAEYEPSLLTLKRAADFAKSIGSEL